MSTHNTNLDARAEALMRFATENDFLPEAPDPHYIIFNQPHQNLHVHLHWEGGRPLVSIHRKLWTAFDETERAAVQRSIRRNDPAQEHGISSEIPNSGSWLYLYTRNHEAPSLADFEDEIGDLIHQHTLRYEDAMDAAIDATSEVLDTISPERARLLRIATELKRRNGITKMGPTTVESGTIRVAEVTEDEIRCRIRGIRRPAVIRFDEEGWIQIMGLLHGLNNSDSADGRARYAAELEPLLAAESMILTDATHHKRQVMISLVSYPPETDAKEIAERAERQAELANMAHYQLILGNRG